MSDNSADKRAVGAHPEIIFRKSTCPMDVLDASRSRPDVFSKQYCGYSTPARSGTCCRKAIRTTNPFIGAFKHGAAMKTDEARKRHENHGNRGSSWIAALGQHACRQSPRSSAG